MKQASELRPAVPFVGLGGYEEALDSVTLEIVVGDDVRRGEGRETRLQRPEFLRAVFRFTSARQPIVNCVLDASAVSGLDPESVSFLCFATAPTLKQTRRVYPATDGAEVGLRPVTADDGLPEVIEVDADRDGHLFRDVAGFDVTYGFVLNRLHDVKDPLVPKHKGTWLARRSHRVRMARTPTSSYEIHALDEGLRRQFGLYGRPLFYVRQVSEAISPLATRELHEVVDIYVDEEVLPRLQAQRPGAATRYIASQIASQVYASIIQLGLQDFDDEPIESGSVYARATAMLRAGGREPTDEELRRWATDDPGRLHAEIQARLAQVEAAETLLA